MACPGRLNPWDMLTVTQHSSFSDWIFLYYLAKNMEPYLFRNMLIELANELRESEADDDVAEKEAADVEDEQSSAENEVNRALLRSGSRGGLDEVDAKTK